MPRIMQQQYYCMVNLHSLILVKVPRSQIPKKCELVPFTLSLAFALVHAPGAAPGDGAPGRKRDGASVGDYPHKVYRPNITHRFAGASAKRKPPPCGGGLAVQWRGAAAEFRNPGFAAAH